MGTAAEAEARRNLEAVRALRDADTGASAGPAALDGEPASPTPPGASETA